MTEVRVLTQHDWEATQSEPDHRDEAMTKQLITWLNPSA